MSIFNAGLWVAIMTGLIALPVLALMRLYSRAVRRHTQKDNFDHLFQDGRCIKCGLPAYQLRVRETPTQFMP